MSEYGRHNLSTRTDISAQPFERGTFKVAYRGIYTDGRRRNTPCVAKGFLNGSLTHIRAEQNILNGAQQIIDLFNRAQVIPYKVILNRFEVWDLHIRADGSRTASSSSLMENTGHGVTMVEPFINGINGWERYVGVLNERNRNRPFFGIPRYDAMAALTHWSYHISEGRNLLCDLQGGILDTDDLNGNKINPYYVLTDPVFLSPVVGGYGENDGGPVAIRAIMQEHQCTPYCGRDWSTPGDGRPPPHPLNLSGLQFNQGGRERPPPPPVPGARINLSGLQLNQGGGVPPPQPPVPGARMNLSGLQFDQGGRARPPPPPAPPGRPPPPAVPGARINLSGLKLNPLPKPP